MNKLTGLWVMVCEQLQAAAEAVLSAGNALHRVQTQQTGPGYVLENGVAVIDIRGVLTKTPDFFLKTEKQGF